MKIANKYSHLNGEEYLLVHKKLLYDEILNGIASVDAEKCRTKISEEKKRKGDLLLNPGEINKEFKQVFNALGWSEVRRSFFVSSDYSVVKAIEPLPYENQKSFIEENDVSNVYYSYNQTDFVKQNVAIEVQLGKYFAVTYDLFVKHLSFYNGGLIDVGIEIVPTKSMQSEMSSGVPFFEKEVHNVLRHGRTTPPVPIVILGVEP